MKPIVVVTSTRTVQREDIELKHYPFIDIVPIEVDESCIKPYYDWLIFTSVNAIKLFQPYLNLINVKHIAAIGTKTKALAEDYSIPIEVMPSTFTQEGLLDSLENRLHKQSILIPCSRLARNKLTDHLREWDNEVQRLHIYEPKTNYENVDKVHELIENNEVTHVTFSSSSAVSSYFEKYNKIDNIEVYAIGEITEEKLKTYHQGCKVAPRATLNDMLNKILEEVE
ncbi:MULTISPECIES: uroporphyrinogen-III synthase [Mammaliicoccus]|uniref:Uroporphyrinogen-III synthase n=1 Tax=Mammaliicoccus lentus TaxID=42858 RepID=A0ABS6GYW3_MAMLE|nr:uroporphyrinogen-III synthase [Mammaliicoccus lentus]MBU6114645.1 uroporphyrinogen-III synthase [Mammaliicoccus lentus]